MGLIGLNEVVVTFFSFQMYLGFGKATGLTLTFLQLHRSSSTGPEYSFCWSFSWFFVGFKEIGLYPYGVGLQSSQLVCPGPKPHAWQGQERPET